MRSCRGGRQPACCAAPGVGGKHGDRRRCRCSRGRGAAAGHGGAEPAARRGQPAGRSRPPAFTPRLPAHRAGADAAKSWAWLSTAPSPCERSRLELRWPARLGEGVAADGSRDGSLEVRGGVASFPAIPPGARKRSLGGRGGSRLTGGFKPAPATGPPPPPPPPPRGTLGGSRGEKAPSGWYTLVGCRRGWTRMGCMLTAESRWRWRCSGGGGGFLRLGARAYSCARQRRRPAAQIRAALQNTHVTHILQTSPSQTQHTDNRPETWL
jgi:hypothetical protein